MVATNIFQTMEKRVSSNDIQTPLHVDPPANLKLKALIVLAIAIGAVFWGVSSRTKDKAVLVNVTQEHAVPTVKIIQPASKEGAQELVLPGTLQAYYSAPVYARVDGYLKHWFADIGTPVKAGQLLADIEAPELDQQLKQAEADLDIALANERLTAITSRRWQGLLSSDSVSQQETDEKLGNYEAKQALVAAARANVERLRALESFKRITAPFNGVVTERKTDIGALINAGHDAGHELFTVADVHKLRLYVSVPQNYINQIRMGMKATLTVPEHPEKVFSAVLSDNSRAVSEHSGTMLIQLEVANADGKLVPGEYADVRFDLPRDVHAVQIPASALKFQKDGLTVATLTPDDHVTYRSIKISRDLGNRVEVATGLSTTDRIVDNPPDFLEEGTLVRAVRRPDTRSTEGSK
ncbi:multidrug resistance protein MdtA precursor [mine drainage metagenome]|uniref:Multidrug resistance protein MdtA n=1 Tax=mine drainage metagenome TaxID=410659 RepID=A0A1J5QLX5_9ZZZZ